MKKLDCSKVKSLGGKKLAIVHLEDNSVDSKLIQELGLTESKLKGVLINKNETVRLFPGACLQIKYTVLDTINTIMELSGITIVELKPIHLDPDVDYPPAGWLCGKFGIGKRT